ncbi:MAG TPA: PEGA domain-containing protein [Kofleriaceae bacterium]|nr:PEGA domain-containing protein [Kofleriaceae bacterium]
MTTHRPTCLGALLATAILALAAAPARADDSVGVVVTGEATMQPQLVAQLETWLRAHGHNLVSAPLPPDAINALIDCFVIEDLACAQRVVEMRAKTDAVVFAQVNVTSGATALDRTVTLVAYWLNKGSDAVHERRSCKRCTDVTMRGSADELMEALAAAGSNRGRIKLTSSPPGAKVTVGGKEIGRTPLDYSLPPGKHRLVFELEGRSAETRRVSVEKAEIATVDVAFGAAPPPGRGLAYAALGGGAALAIAGGIMIGIDEDVPTDPAVPEYLDTAPAGVALAAAGAVAIGVGVYLLVRQPSERSAPAVSLVSGGGVIGWTGRF